MEKKMGGENERKWNCGNQMRQTKSKVTLDDRQERQKKN